MELEATVPARALAELEAVIERGLTTFVEVGQALLEIREARLYRDSHETFENYCRDRWGFSRIHAHRLMEAAEVSAALPIGNTPANEAQARELARLKDDPEAVREVWAEVQQQTDGRPTAATTREVVDRRLGVSRSSPRYVRDTDSQDIPDPDGRICEDCGAGGFALDVWHCPTCAHHWADPGDDACKNCLSRGEYTYRPGFVPEPDDEDVGGPHVEPAPPGYTPEAWAYEQATYGDAAPAPDRHRVVSEAMASAEAILREPPHEKALHALSMLRFWIDKVDPSDVAEAAHDPIQDAPSYEELAAWVAKVAAGMRARASGLRVVR